MSDENDIRHHQERAIEHEREARHIAERQEAEAKKAGEKAREVADAARKEQSNLEHARYHQKYP
jgi:hypothetical protein